MSNSHETLTSSSKRRDVGNMMCLQDQQVRAATLTLSCLSDRETRASH